MSDAADYQPAELEGQRAFLQRLARQLVRGEAAAEDLVQETFLRALERPPASATALRTWLAHVARHLAINRGRGEQRSRAREQRVARPPWARLPRPTSRARISPLPSRSRPRATTRPTTAAAADPARSRLSP